MPRTVSIALALAFCLVGCRDALVDAPPGSELPPPTAEPVEPTTLYLKGPSELRVGETQHYRAESVPGVASYQWGLSGGSGSVIGTSDDPLLRLYDITGVERGEVTIAVRALDAGDRLLGRGALTVTVK